MNRRVGVEAIDSSKLTDDRFGADPQGIYQLAGDLVVGQVSGAVRRYRADYAEQVLASFQPVHLGRCRRYGESLSKENVQDDSGDCENGFDPVHDCLP